MGRHGRDRTEDTRRGDWQLQAGRGADERAVLVGVDLPETWGGRGQGGPADIDELGRLVRTAGGRVVGTVSQRRQKPDARTYLGKGKVQELIELVEETGANLVVFDNDLTPAQGRNLEEVLDLNLLDRTEVILDIFARHARTRQARLQVELAQLQYMLPRLRRLWSHLERQAGGIGTRGPGETQLETDRRLVTTRVALLKRRLRDIATGHEVQRGGRETIFRAALVGYTNAGKSTLMNRVTGSSVYVRDKLFATLDATTRRVEVDERRRFLLTDTVGFIRRLPHHLVESFRATLQEVAEADLLVHVVDASAEEPDLQIESVNRVLTELVPEDRPTLLVFNKLDRVDAEPFVNHHARHRPGALFLSALDDEGPERLRDAIIDTVMSGEKVYRLRVPVAHAGRLAVYHRTGSIIEESYDTEIYSVVVRMKPDEWRRLVSRVPGIQTVD